MKDDRDSQVLDVGGVKIQIADRAMRTMMRELERIARSSLPVLVLGETGVGKEVAARAAHHFSGRRSGPFLPVNCAAVPRRQRRPRLRRCRRPRWASYAHWARACALPGRPRKS